ncbi:MAG: hypothetical protein M3373_07320 [Gemmatimonadota bacterium]|nr:hypothetical protein [Gemmatimonadota bacterium]
MADRKKEKDGYGVDSSTGGGKAQPGGYGDDQGTRVGPADAHDRAAKDGSESESASGPSSRPAKEGLEGAVLSGSGDQGTHRTTGAGSEASEGLHAAQQGGRNPSDASSVEQAGTGRSTAEGDVDRAGSEPIEGRSHEHESGYGGRGGEPKTSSDQRE